MEICIILLIKYDFLKYVYTLTGYESVWINDQSDRILTPKRVFVDPDLPDELTFRIRRKSGDLMLTLKRNYDIDPNADIYFVKKVKDGRFIKSKSTPLEREALAYYQDVDNGAYMTVRCINSLNKRCERVISGNLHIGEISYDLRPASPDTKRRYRMDNTDIIGRRYLLLEQTHIQQEQWVEKKDAKEVEKPYRWFNPGEKQNTIDMSNDTLSFYNLADLRDIEAPDAIRQLKQNYYVKVALCMDSGIWDLYSSKVVDVHTSNKRDEVKRKIRESYSHIMNGVNLRYKTIKDPSISISVIPTDFIFFLHEAMFPHNASKVMTEDGIKYIGAKPYLDDFMDWDRKNGENDARKIDHLMLFTTVLILPNVYMHELYELYSRSLHWCSNVGMSNLRGVCDLGRRTSIVNARDYVWTVQTATHELGHNLGAEHDGEGEAAACKADDSFIMSNTSHQVTRNRTYIANMWTFSICSVELFKKTLKNKECVKTPGHPYNVDEYTMLMKKPAGYIFTPNEQCALVYGQGYTYQGGVTEDLCYLLRCVNKEKRITKKIYLNAARGTICGYNKWCIEGLCVSRSSRQVSGSLPRYSY
ncbi:hypothetical protein ACJMK2_002881 [Sinanodonta woodiana]|uniref:Peptidase M12B domain-containing protein n=1 Tax=Sinanodonta woodiana TaxID=1069815 RepID=A0ABD3XWI9_SINWO